MLVDIVHNPPFTLLDANFIDENINNIFIRERELFTMEYRPGVTAAKAGDKLEDAVQFSRVLQGGVRLRVSVGKAVLNLMLEPELFSRSNEFDIGDEVYALDTTEVSSKTSVAGYFIQLVEGKVYIRVNSNELKVVELLEDNVYVVHRDYDDKTFKIFGGLLCHKYTLIPFLR